MQNLTSKILILVVVIGALAGLHTGDLPVAHADDFCAQPPRLVVNNTARVTTYPDLPNRVRTRPSLTAGIIGRIPAGAEFLVMSGPNCSQGINWWLVNYNGMIGWTAEGNGYNQYWLEPVWSPDVPIACALYPRLTIGGRGRVTPGLPNVIRTAPGTRSSGADSDVIGEIPGGGIFTVYDGPRCGTDGRWWWLVNFNNTVGWTAEGEGVDTYWLEPYGTPTLQCQGFVPSRLMPGQVGRVTVVPPYPNRIRVQPNFSAATAGYIPAGSSFVVLSGPYCGSNTAWWHVSYSGIEGWTVEGSGTTYYLEPAP